jgi:hypothetical protein
MVPNLFFSIRNEEKFKELGELARGAGLLTYWY